MKRWPTHSESGSKRPTEVATTKYLSWTKCNKTGRPVACPTQQIVAPGNSSQSFEPVDASAPRVQIRATELGTIGTYMNNDFVLRGSLCRLCFGIASSDLHTFSSPHSRKTAHALADQKVYFDSSAWLVDCICLLFFTKGKALIQMLRCWQNIHWSTHVTQWWGAQTGSQSSASAEWEAEMSGACTEGRMACLPQPLKKVWMTQSKTMSKIGLYTV